MRRTLKMVVHQLLEIGSGKNSIITTDGYNFNGEFDIDNLFGTLTFNLPYIKNAAPGNIDLTNLKKYDTVILYYDDIDVPSTITPSKDQLKRVFYGYIDRITLSKSKDSITYEVEAKGTLGLAGERNLLFERKTGELQNLLVGSVTGDVINPEDIGLFQLAFGSQTNDIIPAVKFLDIDANTLFINIDGGRNLQEVLSQIREKYAVIIHQIGDGTVLVTTPFMLLSARSNDYLSVNGWDFRLGENVFELNYGDLTSNINAVVVLGFPPHFGVAIDPVMVQLNAGLDATPDKANYNYLIFEQRDLTSDEDCQKVARQKLLEISRNYNVQFRTLFKPEFHVGQPFILSDGDKFDKSVFIISRINWRIDKDDVSCWITGYAHSLDFFPEELVISNTGIADVDVLETRQKIDASISQWAGDFE